MMVIIVRFKSSSDTFTGNELKWVVEEDMLLNIFEKDVMIAAFKEWESVRYLREKPHA